MVAKYKNWGKYTEKSAATAIRQFTRSSRTSTHTIRKSFVLDSVVLLHHFNGRMCGCGVVDTIGHR